MKLSNLLFLLFVTASCIMCKHEPIIETCKPLVYKDYNHTGPGIDIISDSIKYVHAHFNPSNSDELIYLGPGKDLPPYHTWLIKYNMLTRELDTLFSGHFWSFGIPQWGANGWILLGLSDGVWKIKDNGDSLTKIPHALGINPFFTADPNIFIVDNDVDAKSTGLLMTLEGDILDTLFNYDPSRLPSCRADNTLVFPKSGSFNTYKIGRNDPYVVPNPISGTSIIGSCWLTDSTFIWSTDEGIYMSNALTGERTELKATCNSRQYFSPCYSKQRNKVLWTKSSYDQIENTFTAFSHHRLIMMNPDGTEEEEIDIPR